MLPTERGGQPRQPALTIAAPGLPHTGAQAAAHREFVVISVRTLILLAVIAAGAWLWQTGVWRSSGEPATPPAAATVLAPAPVEEAATVARPILSWKDKNGVTHFAGPDSAPAGAQPHTLGEEATMADYELALAKKYEASLDSIRTDNTR
jgi:hypothetical protein